MINNFKKIITWDDKKYKISIVYPLDHSKTSHYLPIYIYKKNLFWWKKDFKTLVYYTYNDVDNRIIEKAFDAYICYLNKVKKVENEFQKLREWNGVIKIR